MSTLPCRCQPRQTVGCRRPPQPPAPLYVGAECSKTGPFRTPAFYFRRVGCHPPASNIPFQLPKPTFLSLEMHILLPREPLGLALAVLGWPSELLAFQKQRVRSEGGKSEQTPARREIRQKEGPPGSHALKRGSLSSPHPRPQKGQNLGGSSVSEWTTRTQSALASSV